MCMAINVEQVIAGYINLNEHEKTFSVEDVQTYIRSLWNAGCGPIRLNFSEQELKNYLDKCDGICLHIKTDSYQIDKDLLSIDILEKDEHNFLKRNKEWAKSFDLFCKLQVDFRTPNRLLDAMGFRFIHT